MFKALTLAAVMAVGTIGLAHAAEPAVVTTTTTNTVQESHKATGPDAHRKMEHKMGHQTGPCAEVFQACKNAGYTRGGMKDGKGIMANCIKPLDQGKAVKGVTIEKAKVDACKADHAAKKAEFDAKMKNDPEFAKKMNERKAKWDAHKAQMDKTKADLKAVTTTVPAN